MCDCVVVCIITTTLSPHARGVIGEAGCGGIEQEVDVEIIGRIHFASLAVEKQHQILS